MEYEHGTSLMKLYKGFLPRALLLPLIFILHLGTTLNAQEADSNQSQPNPKRLKVIGYGSAGAYAGLWIGLHALWYADQPRSQFHFFNDNQQWMMMDKLGHSYSAYQLSRSSAEAVEWAGLPPGKAGIYGSIGGFLWMLPIEIMDAYATEYGASWGDIAANAFGSVLYGSQQLLWKESRIKPKFSFHTSPYARLRPNILGNNLPAQLLKDYNGQTHWFSADLHKFLPEGNRFPKWLNIAFGYGAEEMVYGHPEANGLAGFKAYQQLYIGPDFNLSGIKTNKKAVKILLFLLEGIRLPAPALELNKNRIRFHPVYF